MSNVVPLADHKKEEQDVNRIVVPGNHRHHTLAMQLFIQMPECRADAFAVLAALTALMNLLMPDVGAF